EYDLVTAYEVDDRGDYVSHEVLHHQRRRRAATAPGADSLYLRLKGVRHDFHMDLKTSRDLVAPGFLVQTWGKRGTKSVRAFPPQDLCFYQGSVRAHRNSSVALSTCQGLSGLIRTEEADYFLQPLPSHLAGKLPGSAGSGLPSHVLYKRSVSSRAPEASEVVLVSRKPEPANGHLLGGGLHPGLSQKQHFCGRRKKYMPQPPSEDLFILPDEYQSCLRHKRALLKYHGNEELNVETLVVVDKKMMQNHGHENITTYVLTILNMVSALFKDGTIGGNINIAIVGLILLEEEQPGLVISHHADRTLSSFCQWQSGLVGKDGTRHDHAILLTGLDICSWKNEPCDTLGFAPISGMCSKHRSCTVNEDTGLGLAFTIAHESGHNFGMVHDGEGNMCKKSEGNIMSPTLAGRNGVFSWSPCSRQYLHKFLSKEARILPSSALTLTKPHQLCLPISELQFYHTTAAISQLPESGQRSSSQYLSVFCVGPCISSTPVSTSTIEVQDICKALWCHRIGRKCETKFMPAAEGTVCGRDLRVGCDNILGSDAAEDACGVCKGNNSACVTHKGLYTKLHQTNQYYHMVTIPSGARSIRIYETNTSTSYISVRNALKRYYLNGHWTVDWPGRYKFSGTAFVYRRSYKEPESLTSAGPTNETLIVELLFQGRNPGVAWEYSMPRLGTKKKPIAQPSYAWAIVRSECSVSCGGEVRRLGRVIAPHGLRTRPRPLGDNVFWGWIRAELWGHERGTDASEGGVQGQCRTAPKGEISERSIPDTRGHAHGTLQVEGCQELPGQLTAVQSRSVATAPGPTEQQQPRTISAGLTPSTWKERWRATEPRSGGLCQGWGRGATERP
ncbi:A disintegrin and metalloproteinase with thrombospondin motifs 16, partial [Tupaia chinensis]